MLRVIFADNNLPLSLLIRCATWSDWSHVGILVPGDMVIDSKLSNRGVSKYPLCEFKKQAKRLEVREFPQVPDEAAAIIASQIGKPYDWTAILGMPFMRNWQEDDSWFCSELVGWGCAQVGVPLLNKESWRVTPQDLYEAIAR